jgi:hypothetical protein
MKVELNIENNKQHHIITRHELFTDFKNKENLSQELAQLFFASISDLELAEIYNLKILKKGYFTSK